MDLSTRAGRKEQGRRIRQAAEQAGLTLEELAREVGCSRALLYQYSSGGVLAQPARLQRVAERTGVPLSFFYEEAAGTAEAGVSEAATPRTAGEAGPAVPRAAGMEAEQQRGPGRQDAGTRSSAGLTALDSGWAADGPYVGGAADTGWSVGSAGQPGSYSGAGSTGLPGGHVGPGGAATAPSRQASAAQAGAQQAAMQQMGSQQAGMQQVARAVLPCLVELAEAQEQFGDTQGLLSTCERILPLAREIGDQHAEALAWLRLGNARVQLGHAEMALPALRVALAQFEGVGNARLALSCRQTMGRALLSLGNTDAAMQEFQRVAAGESWANRWQGAISMAAVHEQRGELALALQQCEEALEIVAGGRDHPPAVVEAARSYVMSNQANVYLACGDFAHTLRLTRELIATAERSGQRDQFVEGLLNLAVCGQFTGRWGEAEDALVRAIHLSRFAHDRPRWGLARALRAWLLAWFGETELAKREAKDALHLGIETSSRRTEIQAQLSLGESYRLAGAPGEALYHFDQACQAAGATGSVDLHCQALIRRVAVRLALGDAAGAREDSSQGLAEARQQGALHLEALALEALAAVHLAAADPTTAIRLGRDAAVLLDSLQMSRWRVDALLARALEAAEKTAAHGDAAPGQRSANQDEAVRHGQLSADHVEAVRRGQLSADHVEAVRHGRRCVEGIVALVRNIHEFREDEGVLDLLEVQLAVREQLTRLVAAGEQAEALLLLDELGWPPLVEWAATTLALGMEEA